MRKLIALLALFSGGTAVAAQVPASSVQVTTEYGVEVLVRDFFVKGKCKNVFNIQASGQAETLGFFSNAGSVLAIEDGLLLSSGDVALAQGPNSSVETTASFSVASSDADLMQIATSGLFDVASIEFDFIPLTDQVSFQYVFASEEYCEFVNTIFNDVFGFFVSGPGINGEFSSNGINVAKIPDTDIDVSINTVNHINNADFYIKNELESDALQCGILFAPNYLNEIEYDGFTIPLRAQFDVIPCQTYHIRLVIGDVGDDKLDSGVFLKSQSFDLGETATVTAIVPGSSEAIATEDCTDGSFVFRRPPGSSAQPLVIDFTLLSTGTATEGTDFDNLVRSVTIPAGESSVVLPVSVLADTETEDVESIIIQLETICECTDGSSATLFISDQLSLQLTFPDLAACVGQEFILAPILTNATPPLTYLWNTGATTADLPVTIEVPTQFSLTLTDGCGQEVSGTVELGVQDAPDAQISGTSTYCVGASADPLRIDFSGQEPWSFTYQIDGIAQDPVTDVVQNPFFLQPTRAGVYTISTVSDASCQGTVTGSATVQLLRPEVRVTAQGALCPDGTDGYIELLVEGGTAPYRVEWNQPVNDAFRPSGLANDTFIYILTDVVGCTLSDTIVLETRTPEAAECVATALYIPNAFSPNLDGANDDFLIIIPEQSSIRTLARVEIFSRWGELVFKGSGNPVRWDGTFQDRPLMPGVFLYQVIAELDNGATITYSGDVVLLR